MNISPQITSPKQESNSFIANSKSLFFAILLALFFRTVCYEPFRIPSPSMKPILIEGDYIFVSKFTYGISRYSFPLGLNLFSGRIFDWNTPKRGEIIVFKLPTDTSTYYIKRLVGLPGDRVQVREGILYINGQEAKRERIGNFKDNDSREIPEYLETIPNGPSYKVLDDDPHGQLDNTPVFAVPQGHYFFMGDNRDHSGDSRAHVGYVPAENIVGRAELIFFSTNAPIWKVWEAVTKINLDRFFINLTPKQD